MESPGTAPGSDPLITCAFITIVPVAGHRLYIGPPSACGKSLAHPGFFSAQISPPEALTLPQGPLPQNGNCRARPPWCRCHPKPAPSRARPGTPRRKGARLGTAVPGAARAPREAPGQARGGAGVGVRRYEFRGGCARPWRRSGRRQKPGGK